MICVIAEQLDGAVNRASWEVVATAQRIEETTGEPVKIVVVGSDVATASDELARARVAEVLVAEHAALSLYTADGFVQALQQVIDAEGPSVVLFPHTYQTRDFAPKLATRMKRSLVTDCIAVKSSDEGLLFVRPMFQGKFVADIALSGEGPRFASFQIGACRADTAVMGDGASPIRRVDVAIEADQIRQRPEAPFKEAKQAVDLTQASRIVAVGRGIKGEEHLPLVQELAKALDAEVAASRPICDAGWLPMDRQVGSSGQTVAPTLYLALGISGAIQHLVGMKGARTIVAINKDADAPIFEVADYAIVGDLFEVVPALTAALGE